MIQIKKSYVLELTEDQAQQLYRLLETSKESLLFGERYDELKVLYNELTQTFGSGLRW